MRFYEKKAPKKAPIEKHAAVRWVPFLEPFWVPFLHHQIFLNPRPYFLIYWDHEMFQRS